MKKTTNKSWVRNGELRAKRTLPKAKNWAHVTPAEGRTGKPKRAKPVKLKHVFWPAKSIIDLLLTQKAGTPDCNWSISTNSPFRNLTSRDICYVLTALWRIDGEARWFNQDIPPIEIQINEDARVFIIEDCSEWIKTEAKDEMAPEICNS